MNIKVIKLPQYKYFVIAFSAISLISLILYVYAVNSTVRNVVARQNMEVELTRLTALNSELEFSYITKRNSLNIEKAKSLGFREAPATAFVSRESSVALAGGRSSQ